MANVDFVEGTSTISDFFKFMRERHKIWIKRFIYKQPKPWTEDPILQQYKFTNVFRQLDKGTIALTNMLRKLNRECEEKDLELKAKYIICNIAWYRLFNLAVHAESGPWYSYEAFELYIKRKANNREQIFTGAHLLRGMEGEDKHETYLRSAKEFWDDWEVIRDACLTKSMETVNNTLLQFEMVGGFIAYEITCDLRFTDLLSNATDINTFANIGPGADRGMRRLGLPSSLQTMIDLYQLATGELKNDKVQGLFTKGDDIWCYDRADGSDNLLWSLDQKKIILNTPFELREIEHSLCEFDKYERVRLGQGRPRSKYPGAKDD